MLNLTIVSLLWAFSFPLLAFFFFGGSGAHPIVDGYWLAFLRILASCLLFAPWLWLRPPSEPRWLLACTGALQFGLMYVFLFQAYATGLPGHVIAVFTITTPLLVILLSDLLARRWRWMPWAAAGLAVAGAGAIRWQGIPEATLWPGFLLTQAANGCFALGQVAYAQWGRRQPIFDDAGRMGWMFLGGLAITGPSVFIWGDPSRFALDGTQLLLLLHLGLVAAGLGFFLWNRGATQTGPATLAVFNNAYLPLTVPIGIWLFGEPTMEPARLAAGAVLIGAAFALARLCEGTGTLRAHLRRSPPASTPSPSSSAH